MSGGSPPKDNSVELMRMEQQAAERARQQETQQKAEERQRWESTLGSAYNNSIEDATDFFSSRGLDPTQYMSAIQKGATRTRGGIPDLAAAPGSYFDNLGQSVYDRENEGRRARVMRDLNTVAPAGFETKRITNDVDDPYLDAIYEEQFANADQYIRNLLDRGVVNQSGYGAARSDLEQQGFGARSRLQELGGIELERGRGEAANMANDFRSRGSNVNLEDQFDPFELGGQLNTHFMDFFSGLGDRVRAAVPGSFFNTSGLANIAGAGQGAQNTPFNPAALAGVEEDDEEEQRANLSAF